MNTFADNNGQAVEAVRWQWIADYGDGEGIRQFDYKNGDYHYFKEIDQSRVKRFGMVCPENGKNFIVEVPEGAKLIHFYDNIIQQPMGGSAIHHRLFGFGYENKKDKQVWVILPNDFIVKSESSDVGVL